MTTTFSWQSRRFPRPRRRLLSALAGRSAELAGLPGGDWECAIRFVGARAMARANAEFVGHTGDTDVITFSYFDAPDSLFPGDCAVELLICLDVAAREGAARRESSYARELVLYIVHGLLHASGEDDLSEAPRRRMRRREREVMAVLEKEFDFMEVFGAL